jgi:hypothetical protein
MTEKRVNRRRGLEVGLLMLLLLALGAAAYALSSPSGSPAGGKPSAGSSNQVLAPSGGQTTTSSGSATGSGTGQVALAPAGSNTGNNGNGAGGNSNCVVPSNGNGNCDKTFGVSVGSTGLLYPSVVRNLPVTFSNPNSFDIKVTSYRVSVAVPASSATGCPASSLNVPPGTVAVDVPMAKKGTASMSFPVSLGADAPEGCQNVPFSITVNASAVMK